MVEKIREMEIALGYDKKIIEESEKHTKIIQRRGIWSIKNIKKGEKFSKTNLDVLRPCVGLSASYFLKLFTNHLSKNSMVFQICRDWYTVSCGLKLGNYFTLFIVRLL